VSDGRILMSRGIEEKSRELSDICLQKQRHYNNGLSALSIPRSKFEPSVPGIRVDIVTAMPSNLANHRR
jgi:hypothetical protein